MPTSPSATSEYPLTDAADLDRVECETAIASSFARAKPDSAPYRHWILSDLLPTSVAERLDALPFVAPPLNGESGTREIHNNTRRYIDADAIARHPVCASVAAAFQSDETVAMIERETGAQLGGTYVRLEYAQDVDGFWLRPHTDLGVKKFTLLYYLSPDDDDLGTDIYENADSWSHRAPFIPGQALVFVPANNTWHGFEPRKITGVRKSLILNYVTDEWRAREQLAYPDRPVNGR
jgi:hypothetical protein